MTRPRIVTLVCLSIGLLSVIAWKTADWITTRTTVFSRANERAFFIDRNFEFPLRLLWSGIQEYARAEGGRFPTSLHELEERGFVRVDRPTVPRKQTASPAIPLEHWERYRYQQPETGRQRREPQPLVWEQIPPAPMLPEGGVIVLFTNGKTELHAPREGQSIMGRRAQPASSTLPD
jgi:hypothetical protein